MSLCKINVCKLILRDHFGELTEQIGVFLLKNGSCSLKQIASETKIKLDQVKKALTILLQHNIATLDHSKRGFTEYGVNVEAILWRTRIPQYIYCAKSLYGDCAELVIEDLLHQGQSLMSRLVDTVTNKLNEALDSTGNPRVSASFVYEKFSSLAKTHFIQHTQSLEEEKKKTEEHEDQNKLFVVPPLEGNKRKRSTDESEPPSKRPRTGSGENVNKPSDDGIYWKINNERFHQYFRDKMFISAINSKIDQRAGAILQTMLRLCETRIGDLSFTSTPLAFHEIFPAIPRDVGITKGLCQQYLSILSDDSSEFVSKVGDSGGGMYCVNIFKALSALCKAHLESVVQERFGSKSLRIFKVLLLKKHLEQKQIEEKAMVPAKEAKEILYNMFAQNFVTITEISKTPDHAPARTFYLFRVDIPQLARMLLENSYKALLNAMLKRETEVHENRRLLEKQERVDAIMASLDDEVQKEEILQTITPAEKTQLTKVKHMVDTLDQSELQLDETIFILETFIKYSDEKIKLKL